VQGTDAEESGNLDRPVIIECPSRLRVEARLSSLTPPIPDTHLKLTVGHPQMAGQFDKLSDLPALTIVAVVDEFGSSLNGYVSKC